MADKSVSLWAVVKRLLRSGRLLSVANKSSLPYTLNLTYDERSRISPNFSFLIGRGILQLKLICILSTFDTSASLSLFQFINLAPSRLYIYDVGLPFADHRRAKKLTGAKTTVSCYLHRHGRNVRAFLHYGGGDLED